MNRIPFDGHLIEAGPYSREHASYVLVFRHAAAITLTTAFI